MSELKIDNPAQRLLDILNAGKKFPGHEKCRQIWKKIPKSEKGDEQLLITRLARVMELPARINQVMADNFPDPL